MNFLLRKKEYSLLVLINLIAIFFDYFYLKNTSNIPPAWDQGYHLSNLFKMQNIISSSSINFLEKWDAILNVSDNYRGPLSYIFSSVPLIFSKNSYLIAYLSNNIYNFICILSIYEFCKVIKQKDTGIWAALIFTFSPIIVTQRTTYLIDLPLTSFSILLFLILTKWYKSKSEYNLYPLFSAIIFGFIFLIKPTGIIFFLVPLVILIIKKLFYSEIHNRKFLKECIVFLITFILLIYPWFSRHWITIISSTLNAWQWGIKYQDGLEASSLDGWLFYFKQIPLILGPFNFILISSLFVYKKFNNSKSIQKIPLNRNITIWIAVFFINIYLIVTLMSTKDARFIMPIFPIICIYCGSVFKDEDRKSILNKYKKQFLILSLLISLSINNDYLSEGILRINYKNFNKKDWYHSEVIREINIKNPYQIQTLAILPDTKEINTFNFEAEAVKQGESVKVRQVVSNKDTYKEDLKYFDWFLIKTGDQGVMRSNSKDLLTSFLLTSSSFDEYKKWSLPDNSKLLLLKRKNLNSNINEKACSGNVTGLNLNFKNDFLTLELSSQGKILKGSYLLINNIDINGNKKELNISLANGLYSEKFKPETCYTIEQRIKLDKNYFSNYQNYSPEIFFINPSLNNGEPLEIVTNILSEDREVQIDKEIFYNNKISDVFRLGEFLRQGKYTELFNLVGILNQSDPTQNYLKDAENIYKFRLNNDENLGNLNGLLISQILQRKAKEANLSLKKISKIDKYNGNVFLTKSLIQTYLMKKNDAKDSLNQAKNLKMSSESESITKILDGIIHLAEFKLTKALRLFYN